SGQRHRSNMPSVDSSQHSKTSESHYSRREILEGPGQVTRFVRVVSKKMLIGSKCLRDHLRDRIHVSPGADVIGNGNLDGDKIQPARREENRTHVQQCADAVLQYVWPLCTAIGKAHDEVTEAKEAEQGKLRLI